ncbi:MAG TPA: adenosylcobinamide-GDP ribazoletransferase [Ktedonobacterales bacterium]|nr:adenosylcobinamide-GDP ribazoletransferase [Ktedonobacterales bacterium]
MTPGKRRGSPLLGLALAVEFLTVLPVRRTRTDAVVAAESPDMARALPWFPLVGALLGLALVGLDWALSFVFPLGIRAVALLAFDALVTGMLHLDGFVDCCDALLGRRTVERRLEILRDSRVGAYGALGGALLLIAKFAALSALVSGPIRVLALLIAPILGRWGMVYAVTRYPYTRMAGAGAPFRSRSGPHLILASILMLVLLVASAFVIGSRESGTSTALVLVSLLLLATLLVLLGWLAWASRRLGGGLTGDTYGAACVLVELAVLVLAPPLALLAVRLVGG